MVSERDRIIHKTPEQEKREYDEQQGYDRAIRDVVEHLRKVAEDAEVRWPYLTADFIESLFGAASTTTPEDT